MKFFKYFFSYVPPDLPPEVPKEESPDVNEGRELSEGFRQARRNLVVLCGLGLS